MMMSAAHGGDILRAPRACAPVRGLFSPPGSKSLTQRYMMLAALADGVSSIDNALDSVDTRALAAGLATLGAGVAWPAGGALVITGVNGIFPGCGILNAVDGGTPARFLMAAACLATGTSTLDGSARLRQRPMQDGVDMLKALGAEISRVDAAQLPLRITPTELFRTGGVCSVGAHASSQFISALLLIAPWLKRGMQVRFEGDQPSVSYIDLTVDCLRKVGADAAWDPSQSVGQGVGQGGGQGVGQVVLGVKPARLKRFHVTIEPDASSAVYAMALAAIVPDSEIAFEHLPRGSHQPDMAVFDALIQLGARDCSSDKRAAIAFGKPLHGGVLDASRWPDGSLAVMAAAAFASAPVEIRGLATLAGKESDRIDAMSQWLRNIGAVVQSGADWIRIDGRSTHAKEISLGKSNTNSVGAFKAPLDTTTNTNLNAVVNQNSNTHADTNSQAIYAEITVNPHADHRIAMSAAVAGALRGGVSISDPGCVEKSWPSFWNDWHRLLSGIEGSVDG